MKDLRVLILLPCYNVVQFCEKVVTEILNTDYSLLSIDCSLLLVDDGSTDGTSLILKRFADENKNVHYLRFDENKGKGFALLEGMRYALKNTDFTHLITMDADGQHKVPMLENLLIELNAGADFVIGGRKFSLMPPKSRIANTFMSFLLRFISSNAPYDTQSGLRGFSRKFTQRLAENIEGGRYEMEFVCILFALKQKVEIKECSIPTLYLEKNKYSHFKVFRDSFLVLWTFLSFFVTYRRKYEKN